MKETESKQNGGIGRAIKRSKFLGLSVRQIIYIVIYFVAILTAMAVIHETGHILGASAVGIPLNGIKIRISNWNPEVILPSITPGRFSNTSLEVYYYTGGFFAATFLLCVYFLFIYRKYRLQPSVFVWILGFITAGLSIEQIGNAIVEGHFHAAYIYYSNMSSSVLDLFLLMFLLLGFILHYIFFQLTNLKRKTSE